MATQPDARTALATRADQQTNAGTVAVPLTARIEKLRDSFQLAMPKGMEATRLVRDALTCLRTIKDLDRCDPDSVLGALMTCAQLGLRPGVLGHAWPLPYWDGRTGGHRAQLVIGYQGLIELAHRSGQIASLIARTVHENDHFDVDYGLADSLVHKPQLRGDRGAPIAYYAIVKFTSGGHAFLVMTHTDMVAHRDRYAPRNRDKKIVGPWVDNFDAMALKTTIRQLAKYMPKSTDLLAEAVAADGGVRIDLNPTAPASDVTGAAQMWDGQVLTDTTDPVAEITQPDRDTATDEPNPPAARASRAKTSKEKKLARLHILRNELEGFAGTSDEARELFLIHISAVVDPPREVTSTKDLTEPELDLCIADLVRAKQEQMAREQQRSGAPDLTLAQVATEQAAALRTVTHTEEEPPY